MELTNKQRRQLRGYTCIGIANLRGSDYPVSPTPVHIDCYEERGIPGCYLRIKGAERFIVDGEWVGPSAPAHATCWFCKEAL